MRENLKENEIYFLGKKKITKKKQRNIPIKQKITLTTIILLISFAIGYIIIYYNRENKLTLNGETLETVSVLPKNSKMPKFNGEEDIGTFVNWVSKNLVYPQGYETVEAKIVIEFVVLTNGKLGQIKILEAPKNKVFEKEVINLLKRSPDWEPAEIAGQKKVNMKFILPVIFKNPMK